MTTNATLLSKPMAYFFLPLFIFTTIHLQAQPDLIVVEDAMINSLQATTLNNNDDCYIEEGCVNGLGLRQILRFTTHIRNVGNQDFYVGTPPANPADANTTWEWDQCHGHWHYEGYASYALYDENDNLIPIGFKNGFCLIDVECSGGGSFTYTCNNQGISAGCGDIYSSGLDCQWIDVTDVSPGIYRLEIKVNWDGDPDALGNYESNYNNNTGSVCFDLQKDANGTASITVLGNGTGCSNGGNCTVTTLNLTLDNYPQETSWQIRDDQNNIVATSGGTYSGQPDGATISQVICLPDGCYDFVISDTYGDGICCQYGSGSYQLTDASGNILASGAQFGSSETTNFCVQTSNPCTDADNDGLCADVDCDDNNDMVPAPPGAACDDGDPNTINDEIQADGCSCAGYSPTDCNAIHAHPLTNGILIENIANFPIVNILVFDANWTTVASCIEDCNTPHTFNGLSAGMYHVSIKGLDESWQVICNPIIDVEVLDGPCLDLDNDGVCASIDCDDNNPNLPTTVGSLCDDGDPNTTNDIIQSDACTCAGTAPCTDADNDGVCADVDCDDNDPNFPMTEGTACDDGNSATQNDVILSDGCTCAGTEPGGCNVVFTPGPNNITVNGLGHPNVSVQVFDATWTSVFNCFNDCDHPQVVNGLSDGTYFVKVNIWDASWQPLCEVTEYISVSGTCQAGLPCDDNNPCTDNDLYDANCNCVGTAAADADGDGYCANVDCDDSNPALPTTIGSSCDDGDPATQNDVIAEDGCTCAGVLPGGEGCNAQVSVSGHVITVNGLDEPNTSVKLMDATSWTTVFDCFLNCDAPVVIPNLADATYYINIQTWDGTWQPVCTVGEYVSVGNPSSGLSTEEVQKIHLFFQATKNSRSILLNWTTNSETRNDFFLLERSRNGENFEPIQRIESMNNRAGTFYYQMSDHEPFLGKNYYRLKVVHHDQSFLFSDIEKEVMEMDWADFTLFPNPADDLLLVNLAKFEGRSADISIVDQFGQVLSTRKIESISKKPVHLNIQNLHEGLYLLYIKLDGRKAQYRKFVKAMP